MSELVVIGLNPALQKALIFDHLQVGEVNRARHMNRVPGGKGYHCARAAATIAPASCTVAHFLGGETGRFVSDFHDRLGIRQATVEIEGETRTCTTILDQATGQMTELIEPSATVPPIAVDAMREKLEPLLAGARAIALCGTYPPGVDDDFYAWVARKKSQSLLLLDGYRGVDTTLATGKVDILKINARELRALMNEDDLDRAARAAMEKHALACVAITDGPHTAHLWTPRAHWQWQLPELDQVVNPIGAGDTVAGVMLVYCLRGAAVEDAFGWGLAAASASCRHLEGARFDLDSMARVHAQIIRKSI